MECLGIFIIVSALIAAAAVVFVGSVRGRVERWNEALAIIAARFHGHFTRGGWFTEPVVRLQYGAAEARLTCYTLPGSGSQKCVQFVIQQRDQRTRCELLSWPAALRLAPDLTGLSQVQLEWSGQSERWKVLAADGDEAKHQFSLGVRLALDRLWLAPLPSDTAISLIPGWMVVRKAWNQPRGADLEQFIEAVCSLSDQLQVAAAAGIEFVASDDAQLIDEATCGVCCEQLTGPVVFCGRCQTPCHRECWDYAGGCATYGCGGRTCFVPHEAPLARPPHYQLGPAPVRPKPR